MSSCAIDAVMSRLFFQVHQCLNELLQSCLDYRAFVDANPASELTEASALTSVETAFARQSGLLFQVRCSETFLASIRGIR